MFLCLIFLSISEPDPHKALKASVAQIRLPFYQGDGFPHPYINVEVNEPVTWKNDASDYILITPSQGNQSAKIEVINKGPETKATEITLTSLNGKKSLNISVYIDRIHTIEAKGKHDVLYVNETELEIEVTAKNVFQNNFSPLSGLKYTVELNENVTKREDPENTKILLTKYPGNKYPDYQFIVTGHQIGQSDMKVTVDGTSVSCVESLSVIQKVAFENAKVILNPRARKNVKLIGIGSKKEKINVQPGDFEVSTEDSQIAEGIISNGNVIVIAQNSPGQITRIFAIRKNEPEKPSILVLVRPLVNFDDQYIPYGSNQEAKATPDILHVLDKNGNVVTHVDHDWKVVTPKNVYESIGTHQITAHSDFWDMDYNGNVHVVPPIQIEPKEVRIPLGFNGYKFSATGGSGKYIWKSENQNVFTVDNNQSSAASIKTVQVGTANLIVEDAIIKSFNDKSKVIVDKLDKIVVNLANREFYVHDRIEPEFYATNKDGHQFTEGTITSTNVGIDDETIIENNNGVLKGIKVGFTNISFIVNEVTSPKYTISIIEKLKTSGVLQGNVGKSRDIGKVGGPVKWQNAKQDISIKCGTVSPKMDLIGDKISVTFLEDYEGLCILSIQNQKTNENPNPILSTSTFQITMTQITKVILVLTDPKGTERTECGFVPKSQNDFNNMKTQYYIPKGHMVKGKLYAYTKNGLLNGTFKDQDIGIEYSNSTGKTTEIDIDGFRKYEVNDETVFTVFGPEIPRYSVRVTIVEDFEVEQLVLMHSFDNSTTSKDLYISGGSGNFALEGNNATLNGKVITIWLEEVPERNITVIDLCIPEHKKVITIKTLIPHSLEIIGPSNGVVNMPISLTVKLFTIEGEEIPNDTFKNIKWNEDTKYLQHIGKSEEWVVTPVEEGMLPITITANNAIRGTKFINISAKIEFQDSTIVMFVGERRPLNLRGGSSALFNVEINSSDDTIAKVEDTLVVGVSKGTAVINARVPGHEELGEPVVYVRVLEALDLNLVQSTESPYVGSYVHIKPFIVTDDGDKETNSISWSIDGNDQWQKLYDSSLMIYCDREGWIIVTARSSHKIEKTIKIYVDYKLNLLSPPVVLMPQGTKYQVLVENNLPCNYELLGSHSSSTIDENGEISANAIGKFAVAIHYKQQWITCAVTVSKPNSLFVEPESAISVRPRILDIDGQEYTGRVANSTGISVKFNSTEITHIIAEHSYVFEIPPKYETPFIITGFAINDYFDVNGSAMLFPRKLIYPQYPAVQTGTSLQFVCQSPKQYWRSLNERVAYTSDNGEVITMKSGRSIIQCTPTIETTLTVVDFEGVTLQEEKVFEKYLIKNVYSNSDFNESNTYLADDLVYTCKWNAHECGRVRHTQELDKHYCEITFYPKKLCPIRNQLDVYVESAKTNLKVGGSLIVIDPSTTWGLSNTEFNLSITGTNPSFDIPGFKPSKNDILQETPVGIKLGFRKNNLHIEATSAFADQGVILLEHKTTHELLRINIKYSDVRTTTEYFFENPTMKPHDNTIYIVSGLVVILIIAAYCYFMNVKPQNLLFQNSPAHQAPRAKSSRSHYKIN